MTVDGTKAHIRALIEEELGEFRAFAGLPATEVEDMAARITRALAPYLGTDAIESPGQRTAA